MKKIGREPPVIKLNNEAKYKQTDCLKKIDQRKGKLNEEEQT